jgi:hypothetical protein
LSSTRGPITPGNALVSADTLVLVEQLGCPATPALAAALAAQELVGLLAVGEVGLPLLPAGTGPGTGLRLLSARTGPGGDPPAPLDAAAQLRHQSC